MRVYISSTFEDLQQERKILADWLTEAGHQAIQSYSARPRGLIKSTFNEIESCDLFVLILGDRYGHIPNTNNPEKISISHLEFRHAQNVDISCLIFDRISSPNKTLSDLHDPTSQAGYQILRREIEASGTRPAQFNDVHDLINRFSAAFLLFVGAPTKSLSNQNPRGPLATNGSGSASTVESIIQTVHRSAAEGLNSPSDWFLNWSGEVFDPPPPPEHALLNTCFIDTGRRAQIIDSLKAGNASGITGFIGMGGVGKTFTALRIAWDLRNEGWHICWVSLLQRSTDDVLDMIAKNFGFRFFPNLKTTEKATALRTTLPIIERQLDKVLIVLDNAEQFPNFSDLVGALSHLPVLVTSRTNEQAGRIRYFRIDPLIEEQAVSFCISFLKSHGESQDNWQPSEDDRADLTKLAALYNGHPLSLRMMMVGFQLLPRREREGKRPFARIISILKSRGLEGFASENNTVFSADEPSEAMLRRNMDATFQWLYDDLTQTNAPLVDRCAYLILPICALVGAANFEVPTVARAIGVLQGLLPKNIEGNLCLTDCPVWHRDISELVASRDLLQKALDRLEYISLIDPVAAVPDGYAMHPTIREFAFHQEDPEALKRPSSDLLLRTAFDTLGEGSAITDALLDLLPRLMGQRDLCETAWRNLSRSWHTFSYANFSTLKLGAEEMLRLSKHHRMHEQVTSIQLLLGELLDRMEDSEGLPMLHEALSGVEPIKGSVHWPDFEDLTVGVCLEQLSPVLYRNQQASWSTIYLATRLPQESNAKNLQTCFRAYRWVLDESTNSDIWTSVRRLLAAYLPSVHAELVCFNPSNTVKTNSYADLARLFEHWAIFGADPSQVELGLALSKRVTIFPFNQTNSVENITPQHWIDLRQANLTYQLTEGLINEETFKVEIECLRKFARTQGIRGFTLEAQYAAQMARHCMRMMQWPQAADFLNRAIAATRQIPGSSPYKLFNVIEMSLLQRACICLIRNENDEATFDIEMTEADLRDKRFDSMMPYVQITRACICKQNDKNASYLAAQSAIQGLIRDVGRIPRYLIPLLSQLTGRPLVVNQAIVHSQIDRLDWNNLPNKVRSNTDGRTMTLVKHGIGVLKNGIDKAWMWPFYIDDEPLTLDIVNQFAKNLGVGVVAPSHAKGEDCIVALSGKNRDKLFTALGKHLPTPQERFAAAAALGVGLQREVPTNDYELDQLWLSTLSDVLNEVKQPIDSWASKVYKLLREQNQAVEPRQIDDQISATLEMTFKNHWSNEWVLNNPSAKAAFDTVWVPRFTANPYVAADKTRLLAEHTLTALSLGFTEKMRVALNAPTLSEEQVTLLIEVFINERYQFEKLLHIEGMTIAQLIQKCNNDATKLLGINLPDFQNNLEEPILVVDVIDRSVAANTPWHIQVNYRARNAAGDPIELPEDYSSCVRLVWPVLTVEDMVGLTAIN